MHESSLLGNREIPGSTDCNPQSVRSRKAGGYNLDMHVNGKSDTGVVSVKRTNKGAQPMQQGQPLAESVERRPVAKGNPVQTTMTGTQRPEPVSSALDRIREAAKRDSKLKFTNLLHHVTVDLLRDAYFALKRDVAPGIDKVTWSEYGERLEEWRRGTPMKSFLTLLRNEYLWQEWAQHGCGGLIAGASQMST
jgi:hypothetical protein